eukprot:m51a1_g12631 hypothetical protein (178) ;mRNA; f:2018-3011
MGWGKTRASALKKRQKQAAKGPSSEEKADRAAERDARRKHSREELDRQLSIVRGSTASLGRFDPLVEGLAKAPAVKRLRARHYGKDGDDGGREGEIKRTERVLNKVLKKVDGAVDASRAAMLQRVDDERKASVTPSDKPKHFRRGNNAKARTGSKRGTWKKRLGLDKKGKEPRAASK